MIVAVVGISFAAFTYTKTGAQENTISTGTVTMVYTEGGNGIQIDNAIPTDDETGKQLSDVSNKFDFTVTADIKGKTVINYDVVAVKQSSTLDDQYIKLYLEKSTTGADSGYQEVFSPAKFTASNDEKYGEDAANAMKLYSGTFDNKSGDSDSGHFVDYFRLRMWVDKDYPLDGISRTYSVKVNVYGKGQD